MTGAFNTEVSQMAQAAAHVDDVNVAVQALLRSLQGSVESVAGYWAGAGHTTFQSVMARYQQDAAKLSAALHAIGEQVRDSGVAYATRDDRAQYAIAQVGGRLNIA